MYCSNCGTNVGNSPICPKCGSVIGGKNVNYYTQQRQNEPYNSYPKPNNDNLGCGTIGSCIVGFLFPVIGILISLGMFLFDNRKSSRTVFLSSIIGMGAFLLLAMICAMLG